MTRRFARLLPVIALTLSGLAATPATGPAVSTVGKLLTDAGSAPASMADADIKMYQDRLSAKYNGQRVGMDGGTIIQIVTEGGGVKLISFPPDEPAGDLAVHRSLAHATLRPDQEAAGKKLTPGDKVSVEGEVASVSVKFDDEKIDGKPAVRVYLTLQDATITNSTIVPRSKKKPTTAPAAAD